MAKKKKKVLVIGPLPPPYSGIEVITQTVLNNKKIKEEFILLHLDTQKNIRNEDRGIFNLKNTGFALLHMVKLLLLLLRYFPDLVCSPLLVQHRVGFLRDSSFFLIAKLLKRKVVFHSMGAGFDRFYNRENRIFQKYIKSIFSSIDQIIVISRSAFSQFEGLIPSSEISLIYNPISEHFLVFSRIKKDKKSRSDEINVLFLSHISVAKGAVDFIKVIPKILRSSSKRIKFILAGEFLNVERNIIFIPDPHNAETKIKRIIEEHNLQPYVKFPGVVSGERKIKLFQEADIFVFPSYSEGFGLAPVEAMACGLPIVGTKVGVLPEIIRDGVNGYLVEPGDCEGIAKYVIKLAEDNALRSQMGRNNYALVRERFTEEIFAEAITGLWNEVIARQ